MAIDSLDELIASTDMVLRDLEAVRPLAPPRWPPVAPRSRPRLAVPPRPQPTRRRRGVRVLIPLVTYALVAAPTVAPHVRASVNGHTVDVYARPVDVRTVVHRAGLVPIDGALLSIKTHRVIDGHFDRAVVVRSGQALAWDAAVRTGERLDLRDGRTLKEAVAQRRVTVNGGGLPAVEYGLWHPPIDGATDRVVGVSSGEVVSESVAVPPVAATPVTEPVIGLSFDDGPNPSSTPAILSILHNAGIKATFCIVGYAAKRYPELVKAIHDDGHTLCNHTMHHVQLLGRKSADMITAEIRDDSALIAEAAGERPRFFRAPGGTWSPTLLDEVHRQGLRGFGWNVDPDDYDRPGATVILNRILSHVRPGAVVLMHDGGGDRSQTVAQLPALIDRLRKLGYTFGVPT